MLKIGEKLNSSIPRTLAAMKERDDETLLQLIRDQEAGGAAYLDINTALVGETEAEELRRIVSMALRESGCGIMLDSPNAQVLARTLPAAEGRPGWSACPWRMGGVRWIPGRGWTTPRRWRINWRPPAFRRRKYGSTCWRSPSPPRTAPPRRRHPASPRARPPTPNRSAGSLTTLSQVKLRTPENQLEVTSQMP